MGVVRPILLGRRKKRGFESFREVVTFGKVLRRIVFGFPKHPRVDQVKNDVTEISTALDVPSVKKGLGHGTILVEGVFLDAFEQFLARDVMTVFRLLFLDVLEGMVERLANKVIRAFNNSHLSS